MESTLEAVIAQAKALAELHLKNAVEKDTEFFPLEIAEIASKLNNLNPALSIDNLVPQIEFIEEAYCSISHSARYSLGDANWGNFLYDSSTSEITMIDVNFMNFSIAKDGSPIKDAAVDYSIVMTHFWFLEAALSDEERQLILNKFDETYRAAIAGNGPTDLELAFALIARWTIYAKGALLDPNEVNQEFLYQHIQKLRGALRSE